MKYHQSTQRVSSFLERCEKEQLALPENPYDAMKEASEALKSCGGKEKEAMEYLKKLLGGGSNGNKRSHDNDPQGDDYGEDEEMPHHKRIKLAEEARDPPARCPENQKIVDAFIEYGSSQLERGHTGKGVTHLRAAREIRDYDKVIKSAYDAKAIGYVGDKMASQVEQVLRDGKIHDDSPDLNVSKDYKHNEPNIVHDIRDKPAKCPENQKFVDALADFGEHQLQYGNTGKGTSHLRAAKELHNTDTVITSGHQAATVVGYIGDVIADKIDQILEHGKIVHDTDYSGSSSHRVRGDPAPIVQDLLDNPAKRPENQKIVDALRDYGDSHLRGGYRGRGISHLRAAREIRNSDLVIKSAAEAKQIGMVGDNVANKIDQILRQGHADSDEDYVEGEEEEDEEVEEHEDYGKPHGGGKMPPLVLDVRSHPASRPENQKIVDALADYGQKCLEEKDTGRGVTYLRAAKQLSQSGEVIKSATQAKKVGMIGNKVAQFIGETLSKS
ncbi:hypothetical protein Poli38472_006620 [Pythium oligandrum]|uniref:Crossover junction endonuclease MUS81-like HHH domain-containing protein n=1 Tax=Pythium oligandrum TaxID=41045 RepID=A0A8K1FAV3_PYTOL|nr:hypothetical protein Poli38472_006620 [Pythium oligandrum]|eukprot:TMW56610.1 hypothetical protein Poli38472_006620 [Pythium oligandrum]